MPLPLDYWIIGLFLASREWDRSSAWLERLPVKEEVAGSSPVDPALRPDTVRGFGGQPREEYCLEWRKRILYVEKSTKPFSVS